MAGIQFSVDDVYEMAMQIERNGARFYRKAAGAAKDEKVKEQILKLALMEDGHEKVFRAMKEQLGEGDRVSLSADPYEEGAMFLQAAAEGKVFATDPSAKLTGKETLEETLRTAIALEKDSIVFYVAMERMLIGGQSKEKIERIVKEEVGHINMLNGWLRGK